MELGLLSTDQHPVEHPRVTNVWQEVRGRPNERATQGRAVGLMLSGALVWGDAGDARSVVRAGGCVVILHEGAARSAGALWLLGTYSGSEMRVTSGLFVE